MSDLPSRPIDRRLTIEATLLALLLALWAVGQVLLASNTGLLWFAQRPALAEMVDPLASPLRIPDGREERQVVPLGSVGVETGESYLLRLRMTAGPEFRLLGVDGRGAPIVRRTIPERASNEEAMVLFGGGVEPENLRWRIVHQRLGSLEIERATLYRVRSGRRAATLAGPTLGPLLLAGFLWRHRRRLRQALREPDRSAERVFSGLVFAICFGAFASAGVTQIIDSKYTTAVSQALLERGTLELPADFGPAHLPRPYPLIRVGDGWFHFSAHATAILDAPLVALFRPFGIRSVTPDGTFLRHQEARILAPIAAFLAALLCVLFYRLARLFIAPLPALLSTGICAFGTQVFSTVSRPYWTHTWAVLLLTLALYLVLSPRLGRQPWAYVAAATLLSWAVACRPIYAISAAGVTALVFATKRRFVPLLVGTGMVWLSLFALGSFAVFGSALPPYLKLHAGLFGSPARSLGQYAAAALGTLISPARGLLLFVPISGWALWGAARHWRQLPHRALAATSLALVVAHWLVLSAFPVWWGGQSFGPRLLVDALPWLFLLGVLAVAARRDQPRHRGSAISVTALVLAAAFSIFVNTRGAIARETWSWRSFDRPPRSVSSFFEPSWAWNWRYPQFMAGLLPADTPDPTATRDEQEGEDG